MTNGVRELLRKLIGTKGRQRVQRIVRKWFGLQIIPVPEKRFPMWSYEMSRNNARRFLHFEMLLKEVEAIDGRIVECGVGSGRSLFAFSIISQYVTKPRVIVGFDTFEGIPPPTAEDGEGNAHKTGWWRHPMEDVLQLLQYNGLSQSFIKERISFHRGLFEDTLPEYDGAPIALLHLDIDFYESYRTALRELWPHVAPGGIVAFDEYRKPVFPGATKAVDEFFANRSERPVKSEVVDLYYVVKSRVG